VAWHNGGQAEGAGGWPGAGDHVMFLLCGNSTFHTHISNITASAHQDHRLEVTMGKFPEMPVGTDVTCLDSLISFLQIKSSINFHEKIWEVRH
jgi:hypothetical protein